MSEIQPLYSGEAQFRRYSDTSTQGQQVVFALPGRDELQAFIGKEGKRFMAVFVEIGDDEQPVAGKPASAKPRARVGDLCFMAITRCQDPEFWAWATGSGLEGLDWAIGSESESAGFIKHVCGIQSRKDLDTIPEAAAIFRRDILGPFFKYQQARGRA